MIEIKAEKGKITVSGHANYDVIGKDIVCSAVSTLLQSFIMSVNELTTDKLQCNITAGKAIIEYRNLSEQSQTLINSFFIGVKAIAESYPDNVKLTEH